MNFLNLLTPVFCFFMTCTATPVVIVHTPTSSFTIENVPMGAMPASKPVKQSKVLGGFISKKPTEIPLCDGTVQHICYDGIEYSYLIKKGVPVSEYPKTEEEFETLKSILK